MTPLGLGAQNNNDPPRSNFVAPAANRRNITLLISSRFSPPSRDYFVLSSVSG